MNGGELIAAVGAGTTSYTASGLIPNLTYCFAISAYNAAGESGLTTGICKNP